MCGTEAEEEEKREDRVAEERMKDRQVWNLEGAFTTGSYRLPQFGIIQ